MHARRDPTLDLDNVPVVLWQYQDVICANRAAKALGVKKHMRPDPARALVAPADGKLVHAFCRDWPGPRVRYGPRVLPRLSPGRRADRPNGRGAAAGAARIFRGDGSRRRRGCGVDIPWGPGGAGAASATRTQV